MIDRFDNLDIRPFERNDIEQVFPLMKMCAIPNFYIIPDKNKEFYKGVAINGMSLGCFDGDKLVGLLLYQYNAEDILEFINQCKILKDIKEQGLWQEGVELMSCCVLPEYRGRHLERSFVSQALKNTLSANNKAWFWNTVHKDNIPSIKAVVDNGLSIILSDIDMYYGSHRNLYIYRKDCI